MKNLGCLTPVFALFFINLSASPTQPQIISGDVSISQISPQSMVINAGQRAIIDWKSFSIQANEAVQFVQPGELSAVLNRDIGGQASQILGSLRANGQVYLINSNGIIIGQGAMVNAAAFIASTLDILNDDFLKNGECTFKGNSKESVINLGTIQTTTGDALLIGRKVANRGTIESAEGTVALAAGVEVLVKPFGNERIFIRPEHESVKEEGVGIEQAGQIQAIQTELKADGNLYNLAIKSDGQIDARVFVEKEGRVYLVAEEGLVQHSGIIVAQNGGEVRILGKQVHLLDEAQVDVSGKKGGGTVLIGGDFQGSNAAIYNAAQTFISPKTQIKADALIDGKGGKVILWADEQNRFYGKISAQGGELGGDGGFVEVSGKIRLDYNGLVSSWAPQGKLGTLLLDPTDITISAAGNTGILPAVPAPGVITGDGLCAGSNINAASLGAALDVGSVTINTTPNCGGQLGDVTITDNVTWSLAPSTLTINANNDIYVAAAVQCTNAGGGNVQFNANRDILVGQSSPTVSAALNSSVGSVAGSTILTATTGKVEVGVFSTGITSQVGSTTTGTTITGPISITAFTDVHVEAGTGTAPRNAWAQVGHGLVPASGAVGVAQSINAPITVNATTGALLLAGQTNPGTAENYGQIGHGGLDVPGTAAGIRGDIIVNSNTLFNMTGGNDTLCYAKIGHLGANTAPLGVQTQNSGITFGDITLTVTGVPLTPIFNAVAGTGTKAFVQIGHGGDSYQMLGDIQGTIRETTVSGDSFLTAGAGNNAYAQIGHGGQNTDYATQIIPGPTSGTLGIQVDALDGSVVIAGLAGTQIEASAQIGHGGLRATHTLTNGAGVAGGGWTGDILINVDSTAGVGGGSAAGNYAQIGHGGFQSKPDFIQGDITVNVPILGFVSVANNSTVNLVGAGAYSQIGHGGAQVSPAGGPLPLAGVSGNSGKLMGNITVQKPALINIFGNTFGPTAFGDSPSHIGHGGASMVLAGAPAGVGYALTGNIVVRSRFLGGFFGAVLVSGYGQGSMGAWIGHGETTVGNAPILISGDLQASTDGAMFLNIINTTFGGSVDSRAIIGNGLDRPFPAATFLGNQTVTASRGINMYGNAGIGGTSIISHRTPGGTQTVSATGTVFGSISVFAGNGPGSHAGIEGTTTQTVTAQVVLAGLGGTGGSPTNAFIWVTSPTGSTTLDTLQGDIFFRNGVSAGPNSALIGRRPGFGFSGAEVLAKAAGDIFISADLTVTGSNKITFNADKNSVGLGAFVIDTFNYSNPNTQVGPPNNGPTLTSSSGNITIKSADTVLFTGMPADFLISDPTDLALTPLLPAKIVSSTGNITIFSGTLFTPGESFRNILIRDASITTGNPGQILMVANNDMTLSLAGAINSGGDINLVVDNQAPISPFIGGIWSSGGTFNKGAGQSVISSNGNLRVFTARQPLNAITGTLNGVPYVAGVQFVDTPQEHWNTYFFNPFFGGPGFTLFYKDSPAPPPPFVVPRGVIISAQTALSEMFYMMDRNDNYPYWDLKFSIFYDRARFISALQPENIRIKLFPFLKSFGKFSEYLRNQEATTSDQVIKDKEYSLPPHWKTDGKQYNEVL